jgi:prepilin peptidase CpaA
MCLMGGMGMGDVKLTAAVGAGVGCPGILACLIFIGLVGGLEALVVLVWQGKLLKTFGGMFKGALQKTKILKPDNQPREHTKIPYGVAIALGTAWGMWWTMQAGAAPN